MINILYVTGSKFNNLKIWNKRCYGFTGIFKNEDITDNIKIVVLCQQKKADLGFAGIFASFFVPTSVTMTCRIFLNDDRTIDVTTSERDLIEFLIPYMHVKKRGGKK